MNSTERAASGGQDAANEKMYFYDNFADTFDDVVNMYDTRKRLHTVFDELLKDDDLRGREVLDAGCGTGWFSAAAVRRGGKVTSLDLGEKLLAKVAQKCESTRRVGSVLDMPFDDDTFDYVISSEVIEHVPDPVRAVREMHRVLKAGGTLVLTTPNRIWYVAVWIANTFRLRPYQGLENWSGWFQMKRTLTRIGFCDIEMVGIHLFPFVHPIVYPVLDILHRFNRVLGPIMVNLAVKTRKP